MECKRFRLPLAGVIFLLSLLLVVSSTSVSYGQTFSATVRGIVTDPSQSAVPGAAIEFQNLGTNELKKTTSATDGSYEFTSLLPGTYELSATARGFKQFVRSNVVLGAGVAATLNVALEIGATAERVEVSGQAVLLNTESADHAATLNQVMVAELPIARKTPLGLVFSFAGTTEAPRMTNLNSSQEHMSSMFGIQGGRSGNADILVDGAPSTSVDWGSMMVSPAVEDVQEVQVVRNTYDAAYAKSGGGLVTIVTKGGTNKFHGVAYDYLQNDNLNAKYWMDNRDGNPKGEMKRNQFGGNVSGPLWKSKKLFFLAGYEGLREPSTSTGVFSVPSVDMKQGNFSKALNSDGSHATIYDPFSTRLLADGTYTRTPFSGNIIPQSVMDAAGRKVAALYPDPNAPGTAAGQRNFIKQGTSASTNDKIEGRIDWEQNEKHRIFVRLTSRLREDTGGGCYFCNGADNRYFNTGPGWQGTINDTITPSPTWVVNMMASMSRFNEGQRSLSYGILSAASVGLRASDYQAPVLPSFGISGFDTLGDSSYRDLVRYAHSAGVGATKQLSRHTLKFGGDFRVSMINNSDMRAGISWGNTFSFGTNFTSCDPTDGGCAVPSGGQNSSVSGNGMASLLLGTGSGNTAFANTPALSLHTFGAYIQDSWRVTPKLTLNIGIRYENQRPVTERFNRMTYFDPNVLSPLSAKLQPVLGRKVYGGFVYADSSHRNIYDAENTDFAPRVGLAYRVSSKLVVRGGLGMFYGPATAMIGYDPGMFNGFGSFTSWINSQDGLGYVPTNRLSNAFPNGPNKQTGSSLGLMTQVQNNGDQIWVKQPYPNPYKLHFSFDLQYQIAPGSVFEIGYTGWRARKLMYGNPNLDINQLPVSNLSLGSKLDQVVNNPMYGILDPNMQRGFETIQYSDLLRPFPQFTSLTMTRSTRGARANYNGLNMQFTHQLGSDLNLLATYQYSKTMDNGSEDFLGWATDNAWRDSYNTMLDYSLSSHDMPHSLVASMVYKLPVGKGKKFGNGMPAIANTIVGGWQVAPVIQLHSGFPLYPVFWDGNGNPLGAYGFPGPERPNVKGDPSLPNPKPERWFDTSVFTRAPRYTLGTAPRAFSSLRDGPTRNVDLALSKNFQAEQFKVQFRAEFLNAFNTPAFGGGGYGSWWGSPLNCVSCWGQEATIVAWPGTRNNPRIIQLGLKLEY